MTTSVTIPKPQRATEHRRGASKAQRAGILTELEGRVGAGRCLGAPTRPPGMSHAGSPRPPVTAFLPCMVGRNSLGRLSDQVPKLRKLPEWPRAPPTSAGSANCANSNRLRRSRDPPTVAGRLPPSPSRPLDARCAAWPHAVLRGAGVCFNRASSCSRPFAADAGA